MRTDPWERARLPVLCIHVSIILCTYLPTIHVSVILILPTIHVSIILPVRESMEK